MLHPGKNEEDAERAQKALEAVDKACKLLLDQEQKKRALHVMRQEENMWNTLLKSRRKQLKKEGNPTNIEKADPALFQKAVYRP